MVLAWALLVTRLRKQIGTYGSFIGARRLTLAELRAASRLTNQVAPR